MLTDYTRADHICTVDTALCCDCRLAAACQQLVSTLWLGAAAELKSYICTCLYELVHASRQWNLAALRVSARVPMPASTSRWTAGWTMESIERLAQLKYSGMVTWNCAFTVSYNSSMS